MIRGLRGQIDVRLVAVGIDVADSSPDASSCRRWADGS